jgi:hypothetical protein
MKFDLFVRTGEQWWNTYLGGIRIAQQEGRLDSDGSSILYPGILLATNCGDYFIIELIGATKDFSRLKLKSHRETSIYRYFNQFEAGEPLPPFFIPTENYHFGSLTLARTRDTESLLSRFPYLRLYPTTLDMSSGKGSVFKFESSSRSLSLEHCVIINTKDNLHRCKSILFCVVVHKSIGKRRLEELFENAIRGNVAHAIYTVQGDEKELLVAGQMQSMYLFPGLHETTIGDFMNQHPEIIKKSFDAMDFEYEPYLEWKEDDGTVLDKAINPDLMIQRKDGYFDIYDLKTALLHKKKITKGERRRRRFIDYVEEGVSQLANYREYFRYEQNASHAKDKYGIEVRDPNLVLVVGSYENSDPDEIIQACRKYENVYIIDYDTLCQIYIGKRALDASKAVD